MKSKIRFTAFDNATDIVVKVEPTGETARYFKFKIQADKIYRNRIRNCKSISCHLKSRILRNLDKLLEWRPKGQEIEFLGFTPLWVPSGKSYIQGQYMPQSYGILCIAGNVATFIFWYQGQKYKYVENDYSGGANKIAFQGIVDKKEIV